MSVRTRGLLTAVGVVVLALATTWLLAASRAVAEVGGSCASGGPYAILTPCPEHTTSLLLVGIFLSTAVSIAGTVAALSVGAPNLLVPWVTVTFGGLAAEFLTAGVRDGGAANWFVGVLLAVLFVVPGLYLMSPWQRLYDREPVAGAPLSRGAWWLAYLVLGGVGALVGSWTADAWL